MRFVEDSALGSGEAAPPRRQSLLRSQARYALLPAATPRMKGLRRLPALAPLVGPVRQSFGSVAIESPVGTTRCRRSERESLPKAHQAGGRRGKECSLPRSAARRAEWA